MQTKIITLLLLCSFIFGCRAKISPRNRTSKSILTIGKGNKHKINSSLGKTNIKSHRKLITKNKPQNSLEYLQEIIKEDNLEELLKVDVEKLFGSKSPFQEDTKIAIFAEYWASLFRHASKDPKNKEEIIKFCNNMFVSLSQKDKKLIYTAFNKKIKGSKGEKTTIPQFRKQFLERYYQKMDSGSESSSSWGDMVKDYFYAQKNIWSWIDRGKKTFYKFWHSEDIEKIKEKDKDKDKKIDLDQEDVYEKLINSIIKGDKKYGIAKQ